MKDLTCVQEQELDHNVVNRKKERDLCPRLQDTQKPDCQYLSGQPRLWINLA